MVLSRWLSIYILLDTAAANFLNLLNNVQVNAILVIDIAVGIGASHNLGTKFLSLLNSIGSNITGAGNNYSLILVINTSISQHQLGEVEETITSSLSTCQAAAVVQALAGKNTSIISIADALVLTIEITNLTAANTDITSRYVSVQTNMTAKLSHKALAEAHDFSIGLALWIKVGAALATANRQSSQSVFENLLKTQELDDAEVYGWMEAEATFVWANGAVKLYTITLVYMYFTSIVSPRNTEHNNTLRLNNALQNSLLLILRILIQYRSNRSQNFLYSIMELGFTRILSLNLCNNFFNISSQFSIPPMNTNFYMRYTLFIYHIYHTAI